MFRLLFLPIRLALKILRLSFKFTGIGNGLVLAIGVLIGLLIAPSNGAEFRRRLQERFQEQRAGGSGAPLGSAGSEPSLT